MSDDITGAGGGTSPGSAASPGSAEAAGSGTAADAARIAARTEALFRASGALRDGHFLLKSGRHGDRYLEKFQVLQYPDAVVELCGFLADIVRDPGGRPTVDVVVGPTTGGVLLAFEVARQLGVRGIFAEEVRDADDASHREFRRGFTIAPGERVFLVDDILTTGGSLLAMLPAIEATPGELVLAGVIVDRSGGMTEVRAETTGRVTPVRSLWTLDVPTYEAGSATCPACAAGEPLVAPGSTGTKGV
ncbi:MAG: orotate phosphoribosyltransferase [Chloroflexi bacterium]|nr:orotate phosphoribosyltransferase [Chloroflexota bacterium]